MPHEEGHEAMPEDQFLAELESLFASGSTGLPEQGILGGFWGGTTSELGQSGMNAPAGGRRSISEGPPPGAPRPYFEGDEIALLRTMNTEQLARFQDTLVATGIVREVIPGRLDDNTLRGMQTLMSVANRQAVDWSEVLDGIVASGGMVGAGTDRTYDPKPYMKPDYATLAQEVKDTFRKRLGREPDDYEMQQLTSELSGFDAIAYERDEELRRMDFDAQTTPGSQPAGSVQGVDPMSRFRELFESKYANELDFVEDKKGAAETEQFMQQTAATVSQAARSSF